MTYGQFILRNTTVWKRLFFDLRKHVGGRIEFVIVFIFNQLFSIKYLVNVIVK